MKLELHQNISKKFHGTQVLEFQKSDRLLNILQTVVDYIIFSKNVIFGHFGPTFSHPQAINLLKIHKRH